MSTLFATLVSARDWPGIVKSGVIRVGTTGDYPPLTLRNKQEHYQGFAIDMARSLSQYLSHISHHNIKIQFILTHWTDLHSDLDRDLFDIAMGGITRTEDREQRYLLSSNVVPSGKVALVQEDRINGLSGLNDQPLLDKLNASNLRLVVNPGGTNQRFSLQYLTKMPITVTTDNKEPFLMLRDKQADVMITDRIEARYQIKKNPSLTIINDSMFSWTLSHKVYMVQKSSKQLLRQVNLWLKNTNIQKIQGKWF